MYKSRVQIHSEFIGNSTRNLTSLELVMISPTQLWLARDTTVQRIDGEMLV